MPNNYFQFKQFTIQQENCAMKVCTDACLFGATIAHCNPDGCREPIVNCLDIGTGTGLLSLMLAQQTNAQIDAVEIDTAAFQQAKENFKNSPWASRLNVFNTDILKYTTNKKYDCIISNPPFFEDDLKSFNEGKNIAKHDIALTLTQLLTAINAHLAATGFFAVLLPFHRVDDFEKESSAQGYHLIQKVLVKHTITHPYFRGILFFSKKNIAAKTIEIIIKEENGVYTPTFVKLLQGYYLNL